MINEVLEFLRKDFSFEEGLEMLRKYCSNPGIISWVASRRNHNHLQYELIKLSKIPNLHPVVGYVQQHIVKNEEKPKAIKPKKEKPKEEQLDQTEDDLITWQDLDNKHSHTKYEDMPNKFLQDKWVENRDEYKELQHYHQMLKEANSDSGRAEWRDKIMTAVTNIRNRWKIIDDEIARIESEKNTEPSQTPDFNVNSYRSYISKALKKESLDDKTILEVRHRFEALQKFNVEISQETIDKLKSRGLII